MELKHKEKRTHTLSFACVQCEFKAESDERLKTHIQNKHQAKEVKSPSKTRKLSCELCKYECFLDVQIKKHMEEKHNEARNPDYKCDLCEFGGDLVTDIWNHKLDKHADQSLGYNKADENAKTNMFFNFVAEQNLEVMEEFLKFKSGIKLVMEQLLADFENTMKELKDEIKKQKIETTKAIIDLQHKIVML